MPSFYCIKFGLATGFLVITTIVALLMICWQLNENTVRKAVRKMAARGVPAERKG